MSDAQITGQITIDPPITWGELTENRWATGPDGGEYPDAVVRVTVEDVNTADGVMSRRQGVAIVSEGETNGYHLLQNVDRIVRTFGTAPDGTKRTFTGWLHMDWARGEYVCRIHVVNETVVESNPTLIWPEGARDEDAAVVVQGVNR